MKIDVKSAEADGEKSPAVLPKQNFFPPLTLRQLLKPLLICMAIGGSYTYEPNGRDKPGSRPHQILGHAYRSFIILSILLGCVKQFTAIAIIPTGSWQFGTIILCYFMTALLGLLIFCKSSHLKYGNQRKAFDFWDDKVRPALEELEIELPAEKIKRRLRNYLLLIMGTFSCNTVGIALLATDTLSDGYGVTFAAPFSPSTLTVIYFIYVSSVVTFVWFMHILYAAMFSTLLISTFEVFNQYLEKHIAGSCFRMTCKFQKIRQLHLNLSKMVSELDKDLGYYYATSIVINVGMLSFILYHIIKTPMGTFDLLMFIFWQIMTLASVGIVTVFAAFVNEAVSNDSRTSMARTLMTRLQQLFRTCS